MQLPLFADELFSPVQEVLAPDAVPLSKFYEVLGAQVGNPVSLLVRFFEYVAAISSYYYFEVVAVESLEVEGEHVFYTQPDSLMLEVQHRDPFFAAGNPHPFVEAFIEAICNDDFSFDFLFFQDERAQVESALEALGAIVKFQFVEGRSSTHLTISITFEHPLVVETPQ